ncbi:MAG TPA: hypothetical protein VN790_09040 [Steroidobacteraceae bacterium]|nr:hypothetical protein [Steroidobacteraceae bacterium]
MRQRLPLLLLVAQLVLAAGVAAASPVSGRVAAPAAPAGSLPALTLYAWSLTGAKLYSMTTASGQASFAIDLPPGRYYLFATPADPGAPAIYGAYTEYAACARSHPPADCPQHGLRTLTVGGSKVDGVELTDWYLDDAVSRELDQILGQPDGGEPGEAELAAPKFSEYPAPPYLAARAAALAGDGDARIERDREALTAALANPANFAGRMVLLRIGCGSGCESVAFVDLASGRIAYPAALATLPPRTACTDRGPLKFRRDSRLLTVTGQEGDQLMTRYFVWDADSGTLRRVASLASAVSERCVPKL